MRSKIDTFLNKWLSRKLMVFLIATGLAIFGSLTSSDWVTISVVYIGTQGALDIATKLKQQ
tara:strand:- start:601 stop:783 length:183 start_codon:yes stop_codon:yes gene_type:complete